jgi:hypothetical protein
MLVGWVVTRTVVKIEVSVGSFTAYLIAQRAIVSPRNIHVREEKVAISFHLHDDPNVVMNTVQVVKEVSQPVRPMGLCNESVIHIMEPAERLVNCTVKHRLLKVHCENVGFVCSLLHACFLFSLHFSTQDGGDTFLLNVS